MKKLLSSVVLTLGLLFNYSEVLADGFYYSPTVQVLGQSHIPFILPGATTTTITVGTGSAIAANLSTLAAMQAYPAGQPAYVYLAQNSLSGSLPAAAGFYYATITDTTHAVVYSNLYPGGTPVVPTNLTTWASITNATITPTTGTEVIAYALSIPAITFRLLPG